MRYLHQIWCGGKYEPPATSGDVKLHFRKIQNVGGRHLKNHFNGHNSVAVPDIRIKFGTETKTDVQKQKYLQISLPPKSKMAADRHFENT